MKTINTFFARAGKLFLLLTLFILPLSLYAFDYGLVANLYSGIDNAIDADNPFEFKADLLPRISFLIGDNAEFLLSAGLSFGTDTDFLPIPELLRTEFSMRFGNAGIRAGRINYSDPLSFIANGLFDGVQFNLNSAAGKFTAGGLFTGGLYKKNNEITMTPDDYANFDMPLDEQDFFKYYFAPNRLIGVFGWEHPSIGEALRLNFTALVQRDFASEDQYHNEYFILKAGLPIKSFILELGGAVELSQSDENRMAFAGDFGVTWMLPTNIVSRLSFTGKIAGGKPEDAGDSLQAFVPISTVYYGNIFKVKMSGISVIGLDYSARLGQTFGAAFSALYFVRNDLTSVRGYTLSTGDNDFWLGPEIFARLVWSPVSDLQLNLGGGVFIPSMGNALEDLGTQYRVEITAILALL